MRVAHIETRNIVFPNARCEADRVSTKTSNNGGKIYEQNNEAIMRHMTPPSNRTTDPRNGVKKAGKEITVQKRHYIWSESRFVRTMLPFHSNIRVGYNGTEVDGKKAYWT